MGSNIRSFAEARFVLTASGGAGTRWASVNTEDATYGLELAKMANRGRLVKAVCRLSADAATATNATFYLVKGSTLAATPDDLDVVYESAVVASPSVSTTTAAVQQDLFAEGAVYAKEVSELFTFGVKETHGGAGSVVWQVALTFEVWG